MAFLDHLRPDYPRFAEDTSGIRAVWVLRGTTAELAAVLPAVSTTFSYNGLPYVIEKLAQDQIATSTIYEATLEGYYSKAVTEDEVVDEQYPFYAIDYVQVEKSLKQHPDFSAFTADDWAAVNAWDDELDTTVKADLQYYVRDQDGSATGSPIALTGTSTTGQIAYATLRLKGVESFLDYAPEVTLTTKYFSTTPPSAEDAGQKTSAPSYAPSGYEWLKVMDRVQKQGVRSIVWLREEKWLGARKVLLDKDEIFA